MNLKSKEPWKCVSFQNDSYLQSIVLTFTRGNGLNLRVNEFHREFYKIRKVTKLPIYGETSLKLYCLLQGHCSNWKRLTYNRRSNIKPSLTFPPVTWGRELGIVSNTEKKSHTQKYFCRAISNSADASIH